MRSYEEDQGRITLANLGSYLDMTEDTVHGLYCICRLLPTEFEDLDSGSNHGTMI